MKFLIVGLGNIGDEYAQTRHNIGFKVLDALCKEANGTFTTQRYGDVCEIKHRGHTLILLKPSTYMNLSGKAVNYWMQSGKVTLENVFVVVDDLAIPFGKIRIRKKGSDGGHNGLKSINSLCGGANYPRLRFGIGGDFPKGFQIDHVLGKWSEEEQLQLPEKIATACQAILSVATTGVDRTMNLFNK